MALTPSSMVNLGTVAPNFSLLNTLSKEIKTYSDLKGSKATAVMFICNHCPYVIHIMPEIKRLIAEFESEVCRFIAISSNDAGAYPQDGPELMPIFFKAYGLSIPYLYDESQSVARDYDAACTPDFFIFNEQNKLAYRGRLDDSRPREENPKPLTGKDLRGALSAILKNGTVSEIQFPSMGCNIKWKAQAY
jgi:peroxiredoxin